MTAVLSYRDALNGPRIPMAEPILKGLGSTETPSTEKSPNSAGPISTLFSEQVRAQATPLGTHKGEPALILSEHEEASIAEPFKYTLIGKFSWGRPSMITIRKEIQAAGFKGTCYAGLIDSEHVVFRFDLEIDFQRMWLKQVWSFRGFTARMFKWSTDFSPGVESPVVPIWINFPLLPLHCFNKKVLFSIASVVGKPLKTDMATAAALQTIRPGVARVCVEVDITKEIPARLWISQGDKGRWQEIQVEDKPHYCNLCYKLGHSPGNCSSDSEFLEERIRQKKVWIQKESRPSGQGPQKLSNFNSSMNNLDKGKAARTTDNTIPSSSRDQLIMEEVSQAAVNKTQNANFTGPNCSNVRQESSVVVEKQTTVEKGKGEREEKRPLPIDEAQSNVKSNLAQFLGIVEESETAADEDDEGRLSNKPAPTNDDNNSAHPLVVGHTASPVVSSPIDQCSNAETLLQNEEIRIPFHIELQIEQEPGRGHEAPSAGVEGGGVLNQPSMHKIPSVSALQRMHFVTTESESDHQQYGGSSEWEEDTDSVNYMELMPKRNHKPRKSKIQKLPAPTSSRKLRSNKPVNAFGYESR